MPQPWNLTQREDRRLARAEGHARRTLAREERQAARQQRRRDRQAGRAIRDVEEAGRAPGGPVEQAAEMETMVPAAGAVEIARPRRTGPVAPKQRHIKDENFSITIEHLPTKHKVSFDGWVTGFEDRFASTWSGTAVYGRMDDLYTFQRTGRSISIAFDVLAASTHEAQQNQSKLNKLTQFLYPVYTDQVASSPLGKNQRVLVAPPLLRMNWLNMVEGTDGSGLVGFFNGFSYAPDIDSGQFWGPTERAATGLDSGTHDTRIINYQRYNVQLQFTVLHTHLMGWSKNTQPGGSDVNSYVFGDSESSRDGENFPHRAGKDTPALMAAGFGDGQQGSLPMSSVSPQNVATQEVQASVDALLEGTFGSDAVVTRRSFGPNQGG